VKITGYRTVWTRHEWGRPVGDVNGISVGSTTGVEILVVTTDSGVEGVGIGAHPDVEWMFPAIEGEDPRAVAHLYDRMLARAFKLGHHGTIFGTVGALDMALWDLKAKLVGEPLWRMLGSGDRFVPGYASALEYGLSDEAMIQLHDEFVERGFTSAKLKGGRQLADDLRRLQLVHDLLRRNTSSPGLMLDANESWHRSQAVRHIHRIEEKFDLTWVEEPVRRWDLRGLASVRQHVRAGVATGENLTGLEQLRAVISADAVDIVQVGSAWGITNFLRSAHLAHAHDLPISPIGYTAILAPAAGAVPNFLAAEVQDLSHPLGVTVDQEISDGGIVLGDSPGLGITLDESTMEAVSPGNGWAAASGPHARPRRAGLRMVPEDDAPSANDPANLTRIDTRAARADPDGRPSTDSRR
jgi:L-alanine-DL-glutamate epimerase-like enolase superfamily enzyme